MKVVVVVIIIILIIIIIIIVIIINNNTQRSSQGQILHCKRRKLGCTSAEGRSSTANSGTRAAVLPGIE